MPRRVGPYQIVSELGRGGMAVVYLARQPALGRDVALKELAAFHAADDSLAQRFIREARVAGSLSHPSVVTVFDFVHEDGKPYIAMEYLERGSLRPFVGALTLPQVVGVLDSLLAALAHAETKRIVHRDIKPENLLVTADGGVKIADFGIAKAYQQVVTEEMLTPAGATVGTPAYMAPEQAMASEVGPWTDLYQTGVVAFELLSGRVPFRVEGNPLAVMMHHISEPVPSLPAGTDPALEAWVRSLLEKDPTARPASARAASEALEEIVVRAVGPLWRRSARLGDAPAAAARGAVGVHLVAGGRTGVDRPTRAAASPASAAGHAAPARRPAPAATRRPPPTRRPAAAPPTPTRPLAAPPAAHAAAPPPHADRRRPRPHRRRGTPPAAASRRHPPAPAPTRRCRRAPPPPDPPPPAATRPPPRRAAPHAAARRRRGRSRGAARCSAPRLHLATVAGARAGRRRTHRRRDRARQLSCARATTRTIARPAIRRRRRPRPPPPARSRSARARTASPSAQARCGPWPAATAR